uniref:Uncharacterized protein n=1 Tax=Rhizophora mucronata TaxID=61149 RepID=A0A2P2MN87_RHIMU
MVLCRSTQCALSCHRTVSNIRVFSSVFVYFFSFLFW